MFYDWSDSLISTKSLGEWIVSSVAHCQEQIAQLGKKSNFPLESDDDYDYALTSQQQGRVRSSQPKIGLVLQIGRSINVTYYNNS